MDPLARGSILHPSTQAAKPVMTCGVAVSNPTTSSDPLKQSTCQWCPGRRESHPRLDVVAPAHSGPRRALGVVRQRRALYCAVELRTRWRAASPMRARRRLEESARVELANCRCGDPRCLGPRCGQGNRRGNCPPLYQLSYDSSVCLGASLGKFLDADDAGVCVVIDDASSPRVCVGSGGRVSNTALMGPQPLVPIHLHYPPTDACVDAVGEIEHDAHSRASCAR